MAASRRRRSVLPPLALALPKPAQRAPCGGVRRVCNEPSPSVFQLEHDAGLGPPLDGNPVDYAGLEYPTLHRSQRIANEQTSGFGFGYFDVQHAAVRTDQHLELDVPLRAIHQRLARILGIDSNDGLDLSLRCGLSRVPRHPGKARYPRLRTRRSMGGQCASSAFAVLPRWSLAVWAVAAASSAVAASRA